MAVIEITEPRTFSFSTEDALKQILGGLYPIPGLTPISSPPGIGVAVSFDFSFTCPMNVYCSSDNPCSWQKTIVFPIGIPFPSFTIPAFSLNLPSLDFSISIPPPIFVTCPAFPDSDWQTNLDNKDKPGYVEPAEIVVRDPNTPSMSIANDALKNNTTVLDIFSLWS